MRRLHPVAAVVLLLLLCSPGLAADDPAERAAEAKKLYERGRYADALAIWRDLIAKHGKHVLVADGEASRSAALCLRQQGKHTEAASLFERYLKSHPKGKGAFLAHVGAFNAWAEAGEEAKAQRAGKLLFKRYPDAKGTFGVLVTWLERGWKVPKLATSYDVLHHWAFNRIDGSENPDLRLGVLDLIARGYRREEIVKDGGILYCQAWCHMTAGRPAEAIALGEKYLKAHPRGDYVDRTRIVVAKSYLAASPPDVAAATKLLERVANDEKSKQREVAKELLAAAGKGPPSIQINEGFPTGEGLGRIVVLTNLSKGSAWCRAIEPWAKARGAEVVSFQRRDVWSAASKLRGHGAEFVAVVVKPDDLDNDLQLAMLELSRGLDDDPMPDFHYGYLVARNADELGMLTQRILEKEQAGDRNAKTGLVPNARSLEGIDFFIHYGHGTARRIVGGVTATDVAQMSLTSRPVVFSGACFNGVCSRSFEGGILQYHHLKPEELGVDEVLSLAWIHAGATGLFAALDGDRGEMAGAEWEYFREHAPPLGEVMGHQYRLVFTSLRESFESFPRYTPGRRKNKSFYNVMLRGQTSRILISDPMYRPLARPLTESTVRTSVTHDESAGTLTIRVEVLRRSNGPFVNTLPTKAGTPFREVRVYARAALPEGFTATLGYPRVEVGGLKLSKLQAKHEIWGGRRYVNVQAESGDFRLAKPGSVASWTFRVTE